MALKAELEICLSNARDALEHRECLSHEWFGGKIEAFKEILNLEEQYGK